MPSFICYLRCIGLWVAKLFLRFDLLLLCERFALSCCRCALLMKQVSSSYWGPG
jgi:hypothetical protein